MRLALVVLLTTFGAAQSQAQMPFVAQDSVIMTTTVAMPTNGYLFVQANSSQQLQLALTLSGPDASAFSITSENPMTIRMDTMRGGVIILSFLPTQERVYYATLEIAGAGFKKSVVIRGLAEKLGVKRPYFDNGRTFTAEVGQKACHAISFANPDPTATVTLVSLTLTDGTTGFSLNAPSLPMVLKSNYTYTAEVCFEPTREGWVSDSVMATYSLDGGVTLEQLYRSLDGDGQPRSVPCFRVSGDSVGFGPLLPNQSQTRTFVITNENAVAYTVTSATLSGNTDNFEIQGIDFPANLPPNGNATFSVKFKTGTNVASYYGAKLVLTGSGGGVACERTLSLFGIGNPKGGGVDTLSVDISPNALTEIPLQGSSRGRIARTIKFVNNLSKTIKVTDVSLESGQNFTISLEYPSTTLPITLKSGEFMLVDAELTTDSNGMFRDKLRITTEDGLTVYSFDLSGERESVSDVSEQALTSGLKITPNPSSGPMTLEFAGTTSVRYEVLDLLGHVMASFSGQEPTTWKPASLSAGSYIVRAKGVRVDGSPVTASQRIVIGQ
jgi:hypothetical protein